MDRSRAFFGCDPPAGKKKTILTRLRDKYNEILNHLQWQTDRQTDSPSALLSPLYIGVDPRREKVQPPNGVQGLDYNSSKQGKNRPFPSLRATIFIWNVFDLKENMKAEHISIWKVSQEDFDTEEEGNSDMVFWKYPTNSLWGLTLERK